MTRKQINLVYHRARGLFLPFEMDAISTFCDNAATQDIMGREIVPKMHVLTTDRTEFIDAVIAAEIHHHGVTVLGNEQLRDAEEKEKEKAMVIVAAYSRTCPGCKNMMSKLDHGICSKCNQECSGQNAPRSLTMLMETRPGK